MSISDEIKKSTTVPNEIFEIAEITGLPWTVVLFACQAICKKRMEPSSDTLRDLKVEVLSGKTFQAVCDEYDVRYK